MRLNVIDQGMEGVLDGLIRIIKRWVMTSTPLTADTYANIGPGYSDFLTVRTTKRFNVGDEVILRRAALTGEDQGKYEKPENFRILNIISDTCIQLNQPVQNNWLVANGALLVKALHGLFVQGVYIGDPDNISHYPAITVNAISQDSEWLTLDSVKDAHNVEIGIFVQDSTQEAGYRFLMEMTALVKTALMNNIFPLVNNYAMTSFAVDGQKGDTYVQVSDPTLFCPGNVILIEDAFKTVEERVTGVNLATGQLTLSTTLPHRFLVQNSATVIRVDRFIFNSYPKSVQFGKIHKGTLMKASIIDWFGWEEVINPAQPFAWTDTSLE